METLKIQLFKASTSITLNLAEGSGRWTTREKINFYRIGRGSAYECAAILDLLKGFGKITDYQHTKLKNHISSISAMLSNLIKSIAKGKRSKF